ncbi:MAG: 3-deoxy-manno-octulosonate cytidylyltransferase [Bdellovibrionaceae bacterium]|nr:3-deoxy-manno-octulosonate cytidylyltransferase [Pseudobdellovibrionaceae bacterium]
MKVVGVIPARLASARFPSKLLHIIAGKPLLHWVVENALKANSLNSVVVATDSVEIKNSLQSFSVDVVMTDSNLASGSDRVWAAVKNTSADIIVNIQGDEALLEPVHIDKAVKSLSLAITKNSLAVSTLATALPLGEEDNPNSVKVVCNHQGQAIYFSRYPIPYSRTTRTKQDSSLQHIGLYAYTRKALQLFCSKPPVALEKGERLEQLRLLYWGVPIYVEQIEQKLIGVDTLEDAKMVEAILLKKENSKKK